MQERKQQERVERGRSGHSPEPREHEYEQDRSSMPRERNPGRESNRPEPGRQGELDVNKPGQDNPQRLDRETEDRDLSL